MTTYDVYINGIKPDFTGEIDTLIEKSCQLLQVDAEKITDILSTPSGTCISRSVSEQEALKYQINLQKIGLICVFRPGKQVLELTLEAIETEDEIRAKSCPSCKHELTKDVEGRYPNNCVKCGVIFSKFKESKELEEEKEEIKELLMRSKRAQLNREKKELDDLDRKKRKEQLEKEVFNENPELEDKQSNKTIVLSGSVVVILLVIILAVFLFPSSPEINTDDDWDSDFKASLEKDSAPKRTSNNNYSTEDIENVEFSRSQGTSKMSRQEFGQGTNESGLSPVNAASTNHVNDAYLDHPLTARDSLKNAHDKANKILGAFGLDADAFANNAKGSRNNSSAEFNDPGKSSNRASDLSALSAPDSNNSATKQPALGIFSSLKSGKNTLTSSKHLSSFLIKFGVDNPQWDHFLMQNIENKIKTNNFLQARQLTTYMTSTENYIESLSQIYIATKNPELESEILDIIRSKIDQFPIVEQVKYYSQIGFYQSKFKGVSSLINKAENLRNDLIEPENKLQTALAIGVSYFKAGEAQKAQSYFDKVNELHARIYAIKNKIKASIAIARAYKSVGADTLALKWILNAESSSVKSTYPNIQQLVKGFAYLEQLESVIRIAKKPKSIDIQDSLLYQAAQVFVKLGLYDKASEVAENINTPAYKAIAYSLIAAYDKKDYRHLALAEAVLILEVEKPNEKAIVSSRLAQIFARNKDIQKADELLQMTKRQLKGISASSKNDRLVNILAINYLRSLNQTMAMDLASSIQSPAIKSEFYKNIIKMGDIANLL